MNLKIIKIFISSGLFFLGTISNCFAQEESVAIFRKGDSYYFNSLNKKDRSYRRNMRVEMYQQDNSYYLGKRPKDQIELLKSNDSYFFNDRKIQDHERERKPKRRLTILRRAKSYFLNNDQIHNDRYASKSSFLNEADDRYGSRNSILNEADDSYYLRGKSKEVLPRHYNKMPINLEKDTSYDFLSKSIIKKNRWFSSRKRIM